MKTHLHLKNDHRRELPEAFRNDDVRYTEEFAEYLIDEFSKPGDVVFDPFLGYGTSLIVAERLGRIGYGVEYDEKRWRYVQTVLQAPTRAILGDSTQLRNIELPKIDFCLTSPPYMGKHHRENPFTAYSTEGEGYDNYLADLQDIFLQVKEKSNPGASLAIEVSNLKHEDGTLTTLAWDIARSVSAIMTFQGEIVVTWEPTYGFGYDHSYCLIFKSN